MLLVGFVIVTVVLVVPDPSGGVVPGRWHRSGDGEGALRTSAHAHAKVMQSASAV